MSLFRPVLVSFFVAISALSQSQTFENVTIKPVRSADPRSIRLQVLPNGELIAHGVLVIELISYAYDVPSNPSADDPPIACRPFRTRDTSRPSTHADLCDKRLEQRPTATTFSDHPKDCIFDTPTRLPYLCHRLRPSSERNCCKYGRPRVLHRELDRSSTREPHQSQRSVHHVHGRLASYPTAPSAAKR
jgi:hypothetical protein